MTEVGLDIEDNLLYRALQLDPTEVESLRERLITAEGPLYPQNPYEDETTSENDSLTTWGFVMLCLIPPATTSSLEALLSNGIDAMLIGYSQGTPLLTDLHETNKAIWDADNSCSTWNPVRTHRAKRKLNGLNRKRHQLIYQIDVNFISCQTSTSAPWSSETVGQLIDRISVNFLKLEHYYREDNIVLQVTLAKQHLFLRERLRDLWGGMLNGSLRMALFFQPKNYPL